MQFVIEPIEGKASNIYTTAGTFVGAAETLVLEDAHFAAGGTLQGQILCSWGLTPVEGISIDPRRLGVWLFPRPGFGMAHGVEAAYDGTGWKASGRALLGAKRCKVTLGALQVVADGAVYGGAQ